MASDFFFDIDKSKMKQAVAWGDWPTFRYVRFLNRFLLILFIGLVLIFLFGLLGNSLGTDFLARILGLSIISLIFSLFYSWKESFFKLKLSQPELKKTIDQALIDPGKYNLADYLGYKAILAFRGAEDNSTLVLLNLLQQNPKLSFIFNRVLLDIDQIKNKCKEVNLNDSPNFNQLIIELVNIAANKKARLNVGDVLMALARTNSTFKQILLEANLKAQDIENLAWWLDNFETKIEEQKKWWEWKNLIKKGSFGKDWAAGYTINLDKFSTDLSDLVRRKNFPDVIGHQKEIQAMERILSGTESNNVLIVGEPGSGRKSMVEALAISSVLGESLPEINFKRVVQLDLASLLAQAKTQQEAGTLLETVFSESLAAGNIIIVIDEFHNFVGSDSRPGVINIAGVLSRYMNFPQFRLVAITTFEGLHRKIEENSSILSLFGKVEVSEISERETLLLLLKQALQLERKFKKFISYPALREVINLSGKFFQDNPFPEKAMVLLDEAMVFLAQSKEKVLMPKHIAKIVTEKTQIPVGELEAKEKELLLNLEDLIHLRIINQEEAVKEIASALRRARSEVNSRKGPMGSFLFLGPTGVGKTETAKALAEIHFGSESRMIRLDMSEFQNLSDIGRLLGSSGQEGLLTTKVKESPFSLILLDEIEKAHSNILNLFLQVLDEGHITDGLGRKVDFKNSIIIATSNAGSDIIWNEIKENKKLDIIKEDLLGYFFEKAIFRPEFVNRFDAFVIFKPLSKEHLLKVAELMLGKLKKNLKDKDIDFNITEALKQKIVELGYDPTFGARAMKRVIQDKVENGLAKALLSGKLKKGNRVEVIAENFDLNIN